MKILLFAIGSRGDVQPFITLGKALVAHGHEVSIATSKGFAAPAAAAGLSHLALPMDFQEIMQEPETRAALTSFSGKIRMYRWASELMNRQLDAMWAIGLEAAPDLVIHHFKAGAAPYIARRLGIAAIPILLQPGFVPTREYPQFLISTRSLGGLGNLASHYLIHALMRFGTGMMMKRWRKASALDIGPPMDPLSGYDPDGTTLRVHAYSPSLVPRPVLWPASDVQTGYLFDEPGPFTPSAELEAFLNSGPPPVYIGFGSMPGIDPERIATAIGDALQRTGMRAVVATGWGATKLLQPGPNLHLLDEIPHDWLFPRVSAVIHHGGSGTTHEGLRWGRPTLICPLFADQPFFGRRVADLGAGPPPISLKRINADKLAPALELTQSEAMKSRAGEIGRAMRTEHGVARLCEILSV